MKIADIFLAYLYIFKLMLKFETRFFVMRKCFYKITAAFISIMTSSADIPACTKNRAEAAKCKPRRWICLCGYRDDRD